MKQIPLSSRKHPGLSATVSADDYERLNAYSWHYNRGYAYRTAYVDGRKTTVRMHREVLNAPSHMEVDHINGDKLDNRRGNLRLVTRAQNQQNQHGARADSGTGIRNVQRRPSGRFSVTVYKDKKAYRFGTYDTVEEATAVARKARKELLPFDSNPSLG